MFLGHFAAGFGAKRWAPGVSLGWLILAPLLLDVLWPFYSLAGIERFRIQTGGAPFHTLVFESYPWSHSLPMAIVYGVLATSGSVVVESLMFATGVGLYLGATRSRDRIGSIALGAFIVLIALLYAVSLVGPPPPLGAERLVSLTTMTFLIVMPIAWWIDKHRKV